MVFDEINKRIEEITNTEYQKLKAESRTYGELEDKITQYKKDAVWEKRNEVKKLVAEKMKIKYRQEIANMKILPTNAGSSD